MQLKSAAPHGATSDRFKNRGQSKVAFKEAKQWIVNRLRQPGRRQQPRAKR